MGHMDGEDVESLVAVMILAGDDQPNQCVAANLTRESES